MSWYLKIAPKTLRVWLVIGLLLAGWPKTALAQATGPQYIVQPGDTLSAIAQQFGVPLEALEAANPGIDPAALSIGRALVIPGLEGVSGTLSTHPLEPGESLDSLALRFGLKRETLIRLNRLVNPERLYINESMILVEPADGGAPVPQAVTYPAAPSEGWLALSAAANQNPWALAALNRRARPAGLLPEMGLVVPGGDQPTSALPYPLLTLQAHPLPAQQGRTISLRLTVAQPMTLTAALGSWPLYFNADPSAAGTYYALAGIDRMAEPDLYVLTLTGIVSATGQVIHLAQSLPLRSGKYASERLVVDPATLDPAVTVPELAQIQAMVAPVTPTRYWSDKFALPSVGGITSRYGALRSYNGGPFDAFHTGIDFSGGVDRPVTAPAPGVVVFTGLLIVRGNVTLIDHGWGVYSGFWHQSSINVQVGQRVETGEIIGYQGGTGRVTGPHLHWDLWVGGYEVDPLQWTTEVFP
jgi:murein DD-endopeptidase MepM/ murein hydrolase activator NlpD